ncbi:hypothetical protein AMK06_PD00428 (plasmid) [Rhizobium sp. N541]|nr:hypothetical protein AMK05_PD00426 [Rhizobium sp. N324]ANM20706.1 hypothetical protein AMK06_PD00428 [Rhizobium sp. N541]ANM27091.1 hypothetical protein AMK07_PD00429 [Rhizobium sp. N941]OYD00496.1 hypothetical protein AMK08_PD00427 [Rhizobium sp. N4311]
MTVDKCETRPRHKMKEGEEWKLGVRPFRLPLFYIRCAAHTLCALDQCAAGIRIAPPKEKVALAAYGSFADILVLGFDVSAEKRAARDFLTRYAGLLRFI